jgi:hypothetical protein
MRAALALSVVVLGGCARPPAVHVSVRRLDGPRPPEVVLRCHADGLKPPIKYQWHLGPLAKQVGWSAPTDEPALLAQIPEAPPPGSVWAECVATGDDHVTVRASRALVPAAIAAAPTRARPGELVTVRGSGFGPTRNLDDAIYFVPAWGAARAADHACKGASWSDGVVSACVPRDLAPGPWELRVQVGGELAIARAPVGVAR